MPTILPRRVPRGFAFGFFPKLFLCLFPNSPLLFERMSASGENEANDLESFTLEVSNKMGVHARPAAMIVRIASRFKSDIWITKEDERINAKSIMGIMMLAAAKGTLLKFEASESEISDLQKEMAELFASKFQDE